VVAAKVGVDRVPAPAEVIPGGGPGTCCPIWYGSLANAIGSVSDGSRGLLRQAYEPTLSTCRQGHLLDAHADSTIVRAHQHAAGAPKGS